MIRRVTLKVEFRLTLRDVDEECPGDFNFYHKNGIYVLPKGSVISLFDIGHNWISIPSGDEYISYVCPSFVLEYLKRL